MKTLEMGLGKTVATLTALDELLYDRFDAARVLIIGPKRVVQETWFTEAWKWDHTRHLAPQMVLVEGTPEQRIRKLNGPGQIFLIGRELVTWLVNHYGVKWPFDTVIIDELSSFKSTAARRFRALRKVRPLIRRIAGLTGTPAPNGLLDLWPQIYLLDRGETLGRTLGAYREAYFKPGKRNGHVIFNWDLQPGADKAIYKKLEGLCVSMSVKDWLTLPERINREVRVNIPREQYERLERDLLLPFVGGDVTSETRAILINKLAQMANGAVYDEYGAVREIHSAKLDALEDLIESANGKPVLIYYSYRHDAARIKERFPQAQELNVTEWNKGNIPVMIAHPASAGHGLNLQHGGNIIIWFSLPWSLELYQQANARLDRQGQTERVIIHHIIATDTVDGDIMSALVGKDVNQKSLLEALKARIKKYAGSTELARRREQIENVPVKSDGKMAALRCLTREISRFECITT